jgi:hypothetical protein
MTESEGIKSAKEMQNRRARAGREREEEKYF